KTGTTQYGINAADTTEKTPTTSAISDHISGSTGKESLKAQSVPDSALISITTVPPGAEVSIDEGKYEGNSPLVLKISPGPHTITARLPGYRDSVRVQEMIDRDKEISITLEPEVMNLVGTWDGTAEFAGG